MRNWVRLGACVLLGAGFLVAETADSFAQSRKGYCRQVATDYANQATAGNTAGGAVGGATNGSSQWNQNYWGRYNDCMAGY